MCKNIQSLVINNDGIYCNRILTDTRSRIFLTLITTKQHLFVHVNEYLMKIFTTIENFSKDTKNQFRRIQLTEAGPYHNTGSPVRVQYRSGSSKVLYFF
jgi:hypothetical protein